MVEHLPSIKETLSVQPQHEKQTKWQGWSKNRNDCLTKVCNSIFQYCLCMCVRVCMYIATWWNTVLVNACTSEYTHVWRPEANSEHVPQSFSILFFEPRAHQFSQVGCPIRSKNLPVSCPPSAGVINGSFLWGDWSLNSCTPLVQQVLYWLNHLLPPSVGSVSELQCYTH